MDYRLFGDKYYVRLDKGEEIIASILEICQKERIKSATYNGIGGCKDALIQIFNPKKGKFNQEKHEGMLELVSLCGNVIQDGDSLYNHAHVIFAYEKDGQNVLAGGHMKSATVLYTAEIEISPIKNGVIFRKDDEETGTGFWSFDPVQ